jgi:cytidylate kinase
MIVTIDGPAGSGKSSAARALAGRLGFAFLDTGAMYRAVTLAVLRAGLDLADHARLDALLAGLRLEPTAACVRLNGEDVTAAIRTLEVSQATSAVADSAPVRRRLVGLQRAVAEGQNLVTEGRDQGTVVFPDAACKFFLTADLSERARRRGSEMAARGETVDWPALTEAIERRDRRDAARDLAPMRPAEDAVVLDTTGLSLDEVVGRLEAEVRRRMPH